MGAFRLSRLRGGEWIVGATAIALLALMFLFPWYVFPWYTPTRAGQIGTRTVNGFHGLTHLRWLMLVTIAAALVLVFVQATRRAPALPASMSVIVLVLAVPTSLWLIYRVLIEVPTGEQPAAYLGLAAALALTYGAYRSLREEDRPDPARNEAIPIVRLH